MMVKKLFPYAARVYKSGKMLKVGRHAVNYNKKTDTTHYRKKTKTDYCEITVVHAKKEIIIAWRGTRGWRAWKENLDAIQRKGIYHDVDNIATDEIRKNMVRFHEGLWEGYIEFEQWIMGILDAHILCKPYITGHSRGGGLAQICKFRLDEHYDWDIPTVAFAAMRCAGKMFKQWCTAKLLWIVNIDYDMVQHLPPEWAGYETAVEPRILKGRKLWPRLVQGIWNHRIKAYRTRI